MARTIGAHAGRHVARLVRRPDAGEALGGGPEDREDAAHGERDDGSRLRASCGVRAAPPRPVRRGTSILRGALAAAIGRSSAAPARHGWHAACVSGRQSARYAGPAAWRGNPWTKIASRARSRRSGGKVKEEWGDVTDDPATEAEGKVEQVEGKVQNEWGEAKDNVRDAVDDDR